MTKATQFPTITMPQSNDWTGLVSTLSQLKIAIEMLSGQQALPTGRGVQTGPGALLPNQNKTGRFVEVDRRTERRKIYDVDDTQKTGAYLEVVRINYLLFKDTVTGETWEWKRGVTGDH